MLSSLAFGSFLSYSPHGTSARERASVAVCRQIKRDGGLGRAAGLGSRARTVPAIAYAVRRLRLTLRLLPRLADLLAGGAVLVPMPGCAPLAEPQAAGAPWVPRRICQELLQMGLGSRIEPLLVRRTAVAKSALSRRGRRPGAQQQYESLAVEPGAAALAGMERYGTAPGRVPLRILLVDDVVTRGATLLAGASRLAEAFPLAQVRAFALVRTQFEACHPRRRQVFRALVDPAVARITLTRDGRPWRRDP